MIIPTYYNSQSNNSVFPANPDQMEQLQSIKQTLSLPNFPVRQFTSFLSLGSYQMIMLSTIISLVLSLWTGSTFPIYACNGLVLPMLFLYYGNNLGSYWQWLSILLLGRQIIHTFIVADVILVVCLWHPKIGLSEYLTKNIRIFGEQSKNV